MARNLDEWLEAVSVHEPCDGVNGPWGWHGVSDDDDGGFIAYFRNEVDAFRFRLDYINRKMNP